jgi:hypothetical protein
MSIWNALFDWPPDWSLWRLSVSTWFRRKSSWVLLGLLAQLGAVVYISGSGINADVDLYRNFSEPVIAFELALSPEEAAMVLGESGSNRIPMQTQFHRDYPFIAAYSLTFALLGWMLFAKGKGWSKANLASATLIALGLGAGAMDVMENLHGLDALAQAALPAEALSRMRLASVIKWTLLGVISIPAAYAFWPARGWTLFRIISKIASVLLVVAALGFAVGEMSPALEHYWEFSVASMAWSAAFQTLILIVWGPEFTLSIDNKKSKTAVS